MHIPKTKQPCCIPNCGKPRWSRGRCGRHSAELKAADPDEWARLGTLTTEQQNHLYYLTANNLPHQPWTYEGHEDILARRQRWLDEHPNAPTLMSWEDVDAEIEQESSNVSE